MTLLVLKLSLLGPLMWLTSTLSGAVLERPDWLAMWRLTHPQEEHGEAEIAWLWYVRSRVLTLCAVAWLLAIWAVFL